MCLPGCRPHVRPFLLSLLLTVLLLVLDAFVPFSDAIFSLFPPPTASNSAPAGVYFQLGPSWGTVTLDGQLLTHLPRVQTESPLPLAAGLHHIVWQVTPFTPMTCYFTLPPAQDPHACPVHLMTTPNRFTPSAWVVTPPHPFSLSSLPPAQQQALIQAIQHHLDTLQSTTIVQAGEFYRSGADPTSVQPASQSLRLSLRFLLDTDTSQPPRCQGITLSEPGDPPCFLAQQDCRLFCTFRWATDAAADPQPSWEVAAVVHSIHTYTPLATGSSQPAQTSDIQQMITLHISWEQQTWLATSHQQGESSFDDPNCHTLITLVSTPRYRSPSGTHWTYTSGANRAQGCVAALLSNDAPQAAPSSLPVLFEHFGVLLAATPSASQRWPDLPVASPSQHDLAQQILLHPAFVS